MKWKKYITFFLHLHFSGIFENLIKISISDIMQLTFSGKFGHIITNGLFFNNKKTLLQICLHIFFKLPHILRMSRKSPSLVVQNISYKTFSRKNFDTTILLLYNKRSGG